MAWKFKEAGMPDPAVKSPDKSTRPVEEEVIEEVYHQNFDKAVGSVEYDLEDAWQDLARFTEHAEQADDGAY